MKLIGKIDTGKDKLDQNTIFGEIAVSYSKFNFNIFKIILSFMLKEVLEVLELIIVLFQVNGYSK